MINHRSSIYSQSVILYLSRIDDPQQPGFRQVVFDDGLMQLGDDGIPAANGLRRVEHGAHRIAPKLHSHLADHSILDAVTDLMCGKINRY